MSTSREKTNERALAPIWRGGFRGLILATAGNVSIYYVASAAGVIRKDVLLAPADVPVGAAHVITLSVLSSVVATLTFVLAVRFLRQPILFFRSVAAVVFILFLSAPFNIEGAPGSMVSALLLMHAWTAFALIFSLERGCREAGK